MKKLIVLFLFAAGMFMTSCGSLSENLSDNSVDEPVEEETKEPKKESKPVESRTTYSHDGISYEMNNRCVKNQDESDQSYTYEEKSGASYTVEVIPNISKDMVIYMFSEILDGVSQAAGFDSFQYDYTEGELNDIVVNNGDTYQYNTLAIFGKYGNGDYESFVLDDDVCVYISAFYPSEKAKDAVKAELDRILKSLVIYEEAHITEDPTQSEFFGSVTQTVGTDEFGYVTVPDSWGRFTDLDGGTDFQYSDKDGDSIITLNIFDTKGWTKEEKAELTVEVAAQMVWYNLEENDVTEIEGAQVSLGDYDAIQVYGFFISEDHSLPSMIVCWVFEDEFKVMHYISAEAPLEYIFEVADFVERSYTFSVPTQKSEEKDGDI